MSRQRKNVVALPLFPLLALLSAPVAVSGCGDDDTQSDGPAGGASSAGTRAAGGNAIAASGSGGRTPGHAGSSGAPPVEGGAAGGGAELGAGAGGMAGGAGGMAGSADAGAGGGGDAGAGGESAQCAPGYIDVGGVCESACAPRDLDGASIVLEHGHTDLIGAAYENAQLQLFVSDDSSPIRREPALHRLPESVLIHGKPTSQLEVPDIPALAGLLEPGTTVWLFPEGQPEAEEKDLVWPGFQAYGVAADVFQGDKVVVRLLEHDGSGRFVGFGTVQDELTPPEVFFNPSANVDEHDLNAGTHRHMAWTFTESGLHRLRFELEGNLLGGGSVKSLAHTYRFFLGELSDLPETEPTVLVAHPGEPSYAVGADLSMTAERYGMSSSLPLAWARQCYVNDNEPGAWEPLGTSETLTTKAVGLCQYVACLMDGSRVAVISQPVAPSIQ